MDRFPRPIGEPLPCWVALARAAKGRFLQGSGRVARGVTYLTVGGGKSRVILPHISFCSCCLLGSLLRFVTRGGLSAALHYNWRVITCVLFPRLIVSPPTPPTNNHPPTDNLPPKQTTSPSSPFSPEFTNTISREPGELAAKNQQPQQHVPQQQEEKALERRERAAV
ncbi:hypothetical protein FKM82_010390 [Ascaphus truei]